MPAILITILVGFASSLVARVLLGAGLAFVTYDFINDLVVEAQDIMIGQYNNLPADLLGLLGILKVPQSISIVMSAIGIAAFIKTAKIALGRSK